MKRYTVAIVAVVGSFVISLSGSVAAYAQGDLGGRPAKPDPEIPRSSSIFIHTLEAGEVASDAVLVSSNSDETQTVELYATDGMVTGTGAFSCRQQSEEAKEVGSWIRLSDTSATLEPGEQKEVPFTINLPKQVDVGEHNGCIAFQTKEQQVDESESMQLRFRSAVRVAIVVPGDIHKELSINAFDIVRQEGIYTYATTVGNTGNVSIDADIKVSLRTLFGSKIYEDGGEYPVLANEQLDLQFQQKHSPFWGGFYTAAVAATYNTNPQAFGVEEDESLMTIEASQKTIFIIPAPLALLLYAFAFLTAVLGAYWALVTRRRHREKHEE